MKDVKFIVENQNVYIQYTGAGSRQFTELYCIAISENIALNICNALRSLKQDDQIHSIILQ